MTGYRTIPTKDTMDVDERLGGIITVKQLAYLIISLLAAYLSYLVSVEIFGDSPEAIYLPVVILFCSLLITFANMDRWLYERMRYYFVASHKAIENNPGILRNIRAIEEDKIITLDGRVIAVLKVTPINFPLLSDEAKEARIGAYEMYLRQLVYPTMHLVQSEPVDVEEYLADLQKNVWKAKEAGVSNIEDYAQKHSRFLREFMALNRSRSKYHYVVLSVQDPRFKERNEPPEADLPGTALLWASSMLTEFQPSSMIKGGALFQKPDNYVLLDMSGKSMIFKNMAIMPTQAPPRSSRVGPILKFESKIAMLRYAKMQEKKYYYGPVDPVLELKKEFYSMPLKLREGEFSIDERRRHVQISAGKTRWAYDEAEKHIAVLSDKLEATGLRVHRVKGEELFLGRHNSMMHSSKVKVAPSHLVVDNTYMKVVYARGYPYQVNLGWLSNVVDGREDYDLTMYIYPVSIPEALSTFRGAILKLSTEKKARSDFLDPETEQHLEDVKGFFTQIVSGKEKYFLSSLYITCKAPTKKSLDTVLEKCKSDLAGASIDYETADYDMARAVYSTRLTGADLLGKKREFPSSSLAATFPHISSSMEIDPNGIFFGFDWMGAPIIFDLSSLPNQHISITGESGSGKSYFAKSLIPRYLISGYTVYVTDPDGEYVELARYFGGAVSTVGPQAGTNINPFDLEGRDINDKIRSLLGLFSIICGNLSKYQEGMVSDILRELLEGAQKKKKQVTMGDFYAEIAHRMKKSRDERLLHDLQFISISIRPFVKGGLYGFVDAPTSVRLNSHMQVFDLRKYRNDKALRDFFNYVIFDFISHRLLEDKSTKKALFMDEGWTMVNYPGSEDYVRYIIKDSRKYNVSFVFITQELDDMLQTPAGRSILNNTATQFIFHQKESAMNLMKTTLNLTHEESEKLLASSKGEGLMISDKFRLLFKVKLGREEHSVLEQGTIQEDEAQEPQASGEPKPLGAMSALSAGKQGADDREERLDWPSKGGKTGAETTPAPGGRNSDSADGSGKEQAESAAEPAGKTLRFAIKAHVLGQEDKEAGVADRDGPKPQEAPSIFANLPYKPKEEDPHKVLGEQAAYFLGKSPLGDGGDEAGNKRKKKAKKAHAKQSMKAAAGRGGKKTGAKKDSKPAGKKSKK